MYKYLLFGFEYYYPSGGMEDLVIGFNTIEEFEQNFKYNSNDVWQIVDTYSNFSWQEFTTKIIHHHSKDDPKEIEEQRKQELLEWVKDITL